MFEAEIHADKLSTVSSACLALVDECKVRLDEDGLSIQAVDAANVGMIDIAVPKEEFEQYEADEELIGLNLVRFGDVVGMASKDDTVALELNEQTRKLRVETGGLRYTLSLIDPDSIHQEPTVPDLEHIATYSLQASDIQRGVKAAGLVSDHLAFRASANPNHLAARAEGDTDDVRDILVRGTDGPEETEESLFSLDYMEAVVGELPDGEVTMRLGDDYPVKLDAPLFEDAELTYLVAPRIENE